MKEYRGTRCFDSYPISTFCVCDTIEEARVKRDECNKNDKRPYTDYHILVYNDDEFGGNPYRTE